MFSDIHDIEPQKNELISRIIEHPDETIEIWENSIFYTDTLIHGYDTSKVELFPFDFQKKRAIKAMHVLKEEGWKVHENRTSCLLDKDKFILINKIELISLHSKVLLTFGFVDSMDHRWYLITIRD